MKGGGGGGGVEGEGKEIYTKTKMAERGGRKERKGGEE